MINIENHDQLARFLIAERLCSDPERVYFENLFGGVSNRTVKVNFTDGRKWVAKQALTKLRVKEDWFSDPDRIHREAEGLRQLAQLTEQGSVPPFIYENVPHHILIMGAVAEPHENYKTLLLKKDPVPKFAAQFANLLADIHLNSFRRKEKLSSLFSDTSYFENLRLDPYYRFSAERLPEASFFLQELIRRTRARKLTLVHGDFSPKNILIHDQRLILLDHEVIHFGDPAFDIGFAMAHFFGKALFRISHRQSFFDMAQLFWRTYIDRTGSGAWAENLEFHCLNNLLGCLLARAIGKSPLEYLNEGQRHLQKTVVSSLIRDVPGTMDELFLQYKEQLEAHEQNQGTEST